MRPGSFVAILRLSRQGICMEKHAVVIVAGGKGSRMRSTESKQYLMLGSKPILVHTLEAFQAIDAVDFIALVAGADELCRAGELVEQYGLSKVKAVVAGGQERQDSVYHGLQAIPRDCEWVMVHDAVRPFVAAEKVMQCLREAKRAGAAVLAVPVKDTIKVVNAAGTIVSTPERRSLWAIQTPQAFRLSELLNAHGQARRDQYTGTDDSALMERIGHKVRIVEGDYHNIKITTPEDMDWAEMILGRGLR